MSSTWGPLSVNDVVERFAPFEIDWWVAGGLAIDLFLGWESRPHDDLDLEMFRCDSERLFDVFAGWDLHTVAERAVEPWERGTEPEPDVFAVWGRAGPNVPWSVEIMLADGDGAEWRYRRNNTVTMPRDQLTAITADGVRYGVPEVQLLYKASKARQKDDVDLVRVLHLMSQRQIGWLVGALSVIDPGHPWVAVLRYATRVKPEAG